MCTCAWHIYYSMYVCHMRIDMLRPINIRAQSRPIRPWVLALRTQAGGLAGTSGGAPESDIRPWVLALRTQAGGLAGDAGWGEGSGGEGGGRERLVAGKSRP